MSFHSEVEQLLPADYTLDDVARAIETVASRPPRDSFAELRRAAIDKYGPKG